MALAPIIGISRRENWKTFITRIGTLTPSFLESHEERIERHLSPPRRLASRSCRNLTKRELKATVTRSVRRVLCSGISRRENWKNYYAQALLQEVVGISRRENWKLPFFTFRGGNMSEESHEERIERGICRVASFALIRYGISRRENWKKEPIGLAP